MCCKSSDNIASNSLVILQRQGLSKVVGQIIECLESWMQFSMVPKWIIVHNCVALLPLDFKVVTAREQGQNVVLASSLAVQSGNKTNAGIYRMASAIKDWDCWERSCRILILQENFWLTEYRLSGLRSSSNQPKRTVNTSMKHWMASGGKNWTAVGKDYLCYRFCSKLSAQITIYVIGRGEAS